jgi:uncharacterized protein YcfJ
MNRWTMGVVAGALWTAASAADVYYVDAEVTNVAPVITERFVEEPRQECVVQPRAMRRGYSRHDRHYRNDGSVVEYDDRRGGGGSKLLGGLLGGLLGHQFGGGHGKTALTIVGAFAGAAIAGGRRRVEPAYFEEPERRYCSTVTDQRLVRELDGYLVTYLYEGQEFTRQVDEHPGDRLRVRVEVTPL